MHDSMLPDQTLIFAEDTYSPGPKHLDKDFRKRTKTTVALWATAKTAQFFFLLFLLVVIETIVVSF